MDPSLFAIWAIALTAGVVYGTSGFGYVLVAAPLLTLFIDPQLVVPAITLQTMVTSVPILVHSVRDLRVSRVWPLATAGAVGVPAGTLLLVVLDASVLTVVIGSVVTVTAFAMMRGLTRPVGHETTASVPVGFASGALGASTGLAGPPVIFFYANQNLNRHEFRANIVAHFVVLDIVSLPSFAIAGLLTRGTVLLGVELLPATLLGVGLGIVLHRRVTETLFRRLALGLMIVAGTVAIRSGISAL